MNVLKPTSWLCVFAFSLVACLQAMSAVAQVQGCTDPTAANYDPSATVNDGSCIYNTVFYTPPIKVNPMHSLLVETSGLQFAGGYLWSFNDNGHPAALYRIDTLTNTVLQTVNIDGATNVDWEDIAFDGTYFYIGDFGNNANGARTDLKIYKFPISAIPDHALHPNATVPSAQVEIIHFTYSDQVPVVATATNKTKFDCEAMIVDGGKLHLFSKNWVDLVTTHYVIDGVAAGTYLATPVETLTTNYLVTGADKVPGANMVILIGYKASGFGEHYLHLLSGFSGGRYFNGNKRMVDLPDASEMGQVEGIAFRSANYGYISNEKLVRTVFGVTITVNQKLRSFDTRDFAPSFAVLPIELKHFSVTNLKGINQISWRFTQPVQELKVQYSSHSADFITIHNAGAASGSFNHRPTAAFNCYRLAWKTATGADQYSRVVCISNAAKGSLSNFVLRRSGELVLVKSGSESGEYMFKLFSADGRVVAQTAKRLITPGANKIDFMRSLNQNSLYLLQATGKSENSSLLLRAE